MTARVAVISIAMGLAMIGLSSAIGSEPKLVYNPSESAPRGWYLIHPASRVGIGDYVIVRLPRDVALFAAKRRYLPLGVPVLKRIAAMEGQRVCVAHGQVLIDGLAVAATRSFDGQDRPLTPWSHCRQLLAGELFLLNMDSAASFDSRYFGPVDVSFVRGRATALGTAKER
jgi:conjugative transfer signal peptidase TraF